MWPTFNTDILFSDSSLIYFANKCQIDLSMKTNCRKSKQYCYTSLHDIFRQQKPKESIMKKIESAPQIRKMQKELELVEVSKVEEDLRRKVYCFF